SPNTTGPSGSWQNAGWRGVIWYLLNLTNCRGGRSEDALLVQHGKRGHLGSTKTRAARARANLEFPHPFVQLPCPVAALRWWSLEQLCAALSGCNPPLYRRHVPERRI